MKALSILFAAALLAALPARAEETTSAALPAVTAPPPSAAQPAPAAATPAAPSATEPNLPQLNPAPTVPAPATSDPLSIRGAKPDPALDLLPPPPGERPAMNEPALIPDDNDKEKSTGGKVKGRAATDKAKTEAAEADLLQLVHYRQAETKALHDPSLQAIYHQAAIAHTDAEHRKILLDYYEKFYARILAIDPTVKATVDIRKTLAVSRATQRRVTPSVPPKDARPSLSGPVTLTADQF